MLVSVKKYFCKNMFQRQKFILLVTNWYVKMRIALVAVTQKIKTTINTSKEILKHFMNGYTKFELTTKYKVYSGKIFRTVFHFSNLLNM